ncbi:MAG: hypothetical protein ACJA06_000920 [Halocynthiibacter sp.]|jgi:hypothetical protein
MRFLTPLFLIIATSASAAGFERPIPQAQSATAELWFGIASVALFAALMVVARVVAKR